MRQHLQGELGELHEHLDAEDDGLALGLDALDRPAPQQPASSCTLTRPTAVLLAAGSPATATAGEQLSVRKSGVGRHGEMHVGPRLKR